MKKRVNDGLTFLAISYGEGSETVNFEQASYFWAFTLSGGKVIKKELTSICPRNNDERIAAVGDTILDVLICRNFGSRSIAELHRRKIALYTYSGGCSAALRDYLSGALTEL